MRHLAEAWLRTTAAVGARGDVAEAGAELLGRWAEQHRRYHDLAHLDAVLRRIDQLSDAADDVEVVRLAAWFHDAVYDVTATESESRSNESRSADLAATVLTRLRVDDRRVAEVGRLVASTATHDPSPDDADGAVLSDADLAVLAADAIGYAHYADAVREEYGHVDAATFAAGRARLLRSLLERPAIYRTAHGRREWEQRARSNVEREVARLGG